ncbi:MAG: membrane protein [Candidatus Binatia bacterium]|nr:MAG: membrane protein [Candidatus Binatia bacterium]
MLDLFRHFRLLDLADIGIIAFLIYRIILLVRGTRAAQMLLGLAVVFLAYLGAQSLQLYTLNWILDNFLSSILLVIVVIFQNDIRRALAQVGSRWFPGRERRLETQDVEEVTRAAAGLASKKIGALIVVEREVGLNEYIEIGTRLDACVSRELINSIFLPGSPIHDGALVIQKGRITAAGCILPLTTNPHVSRTLGTRHRAAIGLTEETDAVAIVVSEEDGKISLVCEGKITRDLDPGTLRSTLQQLLG